MSKQKLTPDQREAVRKQAKEKLASGTPPAELVKQIASKYGITTVSARNYLPSGRKGAKSASKKVRGRSRKVRIASPERSSGNGRALLKVVAKLSEGDLRKALGVKRLWTEREELLQKKREVERELRRLEGRVATLQSRISRATS